MNYWDIVKVFLILFVMLGVMYGMLYLLKKYFFSFSGQNSSSLRIKVLSTQTIMPKKFISIVKIDDKLYVLGIAENSINLIDKLEGSPDENLPEFDDTEKPNFLQLLRKNMGLR